jgi:pimeloyl-ACP methyl ester carboxylesterase
MLRRRWRSFVAVALVLFAVGAIVAISQLPALGAVGLLYPLRRAVNIAPPAPCEDAVIRGAGVNLKGWRCRATAPRRGTIVYLHGVADNRASAVGVIERFAPHGFDVVAYDSRAHGESEGKVCTYGFFERDDLRSVVDTIEPGPVVLIGTSLGAAVALQHAARDTRVAAVVAAETFSDLRTVATERAPFFFTPEAIRRTFELAEEQGTFQVDVVSPLHAAAQIAVPVLLVHGEADVDTPPAHSQRVYAALTAAKRLILVPAAGHNGSLVPHVWTQIEQWLDEVLRLQSPS